MEVINPFIKDNQWQMVMFLDDLSVCLPLISPYWLLVELYTCLRDKYDSAAL